MKKVEVIALNGKYSENSITLENNENFVAVELFANFDNFHEIQINYKHNDWDQWVKVDISHKDGTTTEYMPTLPAKNNKVSCIMYLKSGKNILTLSKRFGHELIINDIKIINSNPELTYQIIPTCDKYTKDKPRDLKIELIHYNENVVSVTENGTKIPFSVTPCEFIENDPYYSGYKAIRSYIILKNEILSRLGCGVHKLEIELSNGSILQYTLNVCGNEITYPLEITSIDVGHANSSLIKLPNGKILLVDSGSDNYVFNYLKDNGIKPNYYLLTHFHNDHFGYKDEIIGYAGISCPDFNVINDNVKKPFVVRAEYLSRFGYIDSTMICRYDKLDEIWDLGGVKITALNSRYEKNGAENIVWNDSEIEFNEHNYENATSVSFILRYNGFGYYHGADNYAYTQRLNIEDFKTSDSPYQLKCEYFYANHHFHCDLDLDFIKTVNPVAVYIPANQAVYSRSTYNYDYIKHFVEKDFIGKRLKDTFISHANGSVKVCVNNEFDWHYFSLK